MTYVITQACVDIMDKSCIEECPVDCIYEGDRMLYINPDECVDCGACEPVCPQEAIYHEMDVPDSMEIFVGAAQRLVDATEAAGGAAQRGRLGTDIPELSDVAPQQGESLGRPET